MPVAYSYDAKLMDRSNGRHAVYDGDTVWLVVRKTSTFTLDMGFGIFFDLSVSMRYNLRSCRLYGIDTPELNKRASRKEGVLARDYLLSKLAGREWFKIETYKDHERGKYGRYLVRIFNDDGTCINDEMVKQGHAVYRQY